MTGALLGVQGGSHGGIHKNIQSKYEWEFLELYKKKSISSV